MSDSVPPPQQPSHGFSSVEDIQPPSPKKSSTPIVVIVLVVLGCGCLGGVAILAAILFPVFAQAKVAAVRSKTVSNLKQLGTTMAIYAADSDDVAPIASKWVDQTEPYGKPTYYNRIENKPWGIAMNSAMSGIPLVVIPEPSSTIMFFCSTKEERNAHDNVESLLVEKDGKAGFGFADTSAGFKSSDTSLQIDAKNTPLVWPSNTP